MAGKNILPTYGLHKGSGQARCYVNGRSVYLGPYGSEASRIRFGEVVSKLLGGQQIDPIASNRCTTGDSLPTVVELIQAFTTYAEAYYRKPDGTPTDEIHCLKSALKPVREMFGFTPTRDFTPLMLKAAREKYIENGWTRGFCNRSTNRVRGVFKWGVENGLVPVATWQALTAITPLKAGRCDAHDNEKRVAVPDEALDAVRLRLKQRNRDLLDLLLLTAARIGELLSVKWSMIDKSADVWVVVLEHHKTAYRGKTRKLHFGKKAQAILGRYEHVQADARIFDARRDTFSKALASACKRAKVARFVPHQLRHTAATKIRDTIGVEAAQAMLGHAAAAMTAIYTRKTDRLAQETAAAVG
jgi:integrase